MPYYPPLVAAEEYSTTGSGIRVFTKGTKVKDAAVQAQVKVVEPTSETATVSASYTTTVK